MILFAGRNSSARKESTRRTLKSARARIDERGDPQGPIWSWRKGLEKVEKVRKHSSKEMLPTNIALEDVMWRKSIVLVRGRVKEKVRVRPS